MQNFIDCFGSMYQEAGLSVEKAEGLTIANAFSSGADYNVITNTCPDLKALNSEKVRAVLQKVAGLDSPFLLVQDEALPYCNKDFLASFGFQYVESSVCVEVDHDNYSSTHDLGTNEYQVSRVNDELKFNAWCEIVDEAFGIANGESDRLFRQIKQYIFDQDSSHQLFILGDGCQNPVSASLLYLPKNKSSDAGHYAWGTKAKYRKKGAMTYLVREMVGVARDRGFKKSVAQCYDTSLRLAEKIGFKPFAKLAVYSNVASKKSEC